MSKTASITLRIRETGADDEQRFVYDVLVDRKRIARNLSLSPEQAQTARGFSKEFNEFFERKPESGIASEKLNALGAALFDLWLAPVWDKVKGEIPTGTHRMLIIASDVPAVLNLPWEMLCRILRMGVGRYSEDGTEHGTRRPECLRHLLHGRISARAVQA